jgi:hypothetical protein
MKENLQNPHPCQGIKFRQWTNPATRRNGEGPMSGKGGLRVTVFEMKPLEMKQITSEKICSPF